MKSSVARSLPHLLRDWLAQNPGVDHSASTHSRILLFADTSGFTVLTRMLSLQGRVGFEHLTHLLNTLFQSLAGVIARHDGDILKFSGDAVWCCFPKTTDIVTLYSEMLAEIERINGEHSVCRQFPLSLHAGASTGSFELLTVNSSIGRAEFEIVGHALVDAYQACDIAKAGELCLTPALGVQIAEEYITRTDGDFVVVSPGPSSVRSTHDSSVITHTADSVDERYIKYVPQALVQRFLTTGDQGDIGSEHRRVYVVFVNVQPVSPEIGSPELQAHLAKIMDAIHDSHGIIARIDPFGAGHKVLALIGAITATGNDALHTLKSAVSLVEIESRFFTNRIGVAAGPLLCGEVGSHSRREFTVMGNAVNLAARLMSKADPNGSLLDAEFFGEVSAFCRARSVQLTLKGFDLPVSAYAFEALRRQDVTLPKPRQFFGRKQEIETIESQIARIESEGPIWLAISGAAGVGKSSLAATVVSRSQVQNIIYLDAASSNLRSGGWLIYELLRQALKISETDDPVQVLSQHCSEQWLPLIISLSGESSTNLEFARDLTPQLRVAKIAEVVGTCLKTAVHSGIIVLDNLESLDTLSIEILKALIARLDSLRSIVVLIDSDNRWDEAGKTVVPLPLEGLADADLRLWFDSVLVAGKRESDLIDRLISASAGNPLFVEESLEYLISTGALAHASDPNRYDVVGSVGDMVLSGRIEELQLARFDQLSEKDRNLLKAAAVYPAEFDSADIQLLRPEWTIGSIESEIATLCDTHILVSAGRLSSAGLTSYRFSRGVLRDTVYNRTPVLQLQGWHSRVSDCLLQNHSDDIIYDLAYHLTRSDRPVEAFSHNLKAALAARDRQLPLLASRHYRECGDCLKLAGPLSIVESERFSYFENATEFYLAEGDYAQAMAIAGAWRRLARQCGERPQLHAAASAMAHLFWKQSRYNLCRLILKFITREFGKSDTSLLADTYALQGELYRRTGKIPEAQESCRRAVNIAESIGESQRLAVALNNLGLACWSGGNLDEARRCFERCQGLHESSNSRYDEARAANNLAIISEEQGDYRRARELANFARVVFLEYGDRRNQSYASGNLANLQAQAGRLREAVELFTTADRIFTHLGEMHPHYYTIGNLGDIDLVLGNVTEASSKYRAVLDFARTSGDKELEAETTVRLTECAFYGGVIDGVEQQYKSAISIAQEAGSLEYQTRGTVGLCRYLIGVRDAVSASLQIERLRAFANEAKSLRSHNEAEFLQGELHRITLSPELAIAAFNRCYDYARSQDQFELLLKSLARLVELDRDHTAKHRSELAVLLSQFSQWNGGTMLQNLLASSYYRFFLSTLQDALVNASVAPSPQTIG